MRIINIVSSVDRINYGVWHASSIADRCLEESFGVDSILATCQPLTSVESYGGRIVSLTSREKKKSGFQRWLSGYSKRNTIVITHGAWLLPTRLGWWAKQLGFKWIYVPQGMLEPWSFSQSKLKKLLYYNLFERRMVRHADLIRAVSDVELRNLRELFQNRIFRVFNGIDGPSTDKIRKSQGVTEFLFLARLHKKKGIVPLVHAWHEVMAGNQNVCLTVAGPDHGEFRKIRNLVKGNINYVGPVYGKNKEELLDRSHYYLLPSFSEGFPTSVIEAMSRGAIPVVTDGCNIPDIFLKNLGHRIEPTSESIKEKLCYLSHIAFPHDLSLKVREYTAENFTASVTGKQLYAIYVELLNL